MNTEPRKEMYAAEKGLRKVLTKLPVHLVRLVYNNWPWKLLAVFLAVCLWAGLISQDATLTRERVFTDVSVNATGQDNLRRNSGLIVVSGLEPENLKVRMRVNVPQREYTSVAASNYNPRLDLSRITEPGEQTLRISTTSSTAYGIVQDVTPSTFDVMVDEYVTNYRVPVVVNVMGEYPTGYYGGAISLDPSVVALSGPRSIVDEIESIHVDFDVSRLEARAGTVRRALRMRFVDGDGSDVESDLLEVTSADVVLRTIIVEQTLYPTRLIPISGSALTTGQPADGYQVTKVMVSPSVLRAAGEKDALHAVDQLFIENAVDVTGKTESFTASVRARKPAELAYLSADAITVSVTIEPVVISRTFEEVRLSARGTGDGYRVSFSEKSVCAAVSGPQLAVQDLRSAKVTAYVDVTDLEAGEYELPVEFQVEDAAEDAFDFHGTPATVMATIAEK